MKLHILSSIGLATLSLVSTADEILHDHQVQAPSGSNSPDTHIPNLNKVGLRLVEGNGVETIASNYGFHDCGLVNALTQADVQQTFVLRNDGNALLTGLRLLHRLPSGMQVLASLSGQKRAAPQLLTIGTALPPLPPRQTLTLFVTLPLRGRPGGNLRETVLLTLPHQSHPVAALEMRADLVPLVAFSTPAVNFGRVPAGQSRVVPLTLTLNPRLAPLGSLPRLYCSNPDMRIVPVPVQEKDKRHSPLLSKEQQGAGLYAYLLTLPADAAVGTLSGTIRVVAIQPPPAPPSLAPLKTNVAKLPVTPLAPAVVADVLRGVSVPIVGQIVGDVSVTPPTVVFAAAPQGQTSVQQVRITVKDAKLLQGLQINSAVSWLSVRLLPAETRLPLPAPQNALTAQSLEILLDAQAPLGRLQTQLTLQFSNGQKLRIPVFVQTQAKGKG